jgi:hypothetical protein
MLSNVTTVEKGIKSVSMKDMGNEKTTIIIKISVLADGRRLLPDVILQRKIPRETLLADVVFRCQEKG